jgi:hypothetical protein
MQFEANAMSIKQQQNTTGGGPTLFHRQLFGFRNRGRPLHCNPTIRGRIDRQEELAARGKVQRHHSGTMKASNNRECRERRRVPHMDIGVLPNLTCGCDIAIPSIADTRITAVSLQAHQQGRRRGEHTNRNPLHKISNGTKRRKRHSMNE